MDFFSQSVIWYNKYKVRAISTINALLHIEIIYSVLLDGYNKNFSIVCHFEETILSISFLSY